VAHLLAISGSHIVFFAAMAWWGVMLIPLRPRQRELLIAGIVGMYVLATPCGPPIIRAAVALGMVVISRLAGRPAQYLNMLAAAAIVIVLWRPADIGDAGFQLSFISTAGLILFAERLYKGLFGAYLERQSLIAELAATRWARRKLWAKKWVCGGLVANLIGAVTAAPLVAYHFGQVNLWAVVAGIIALPVVSIALVFAALQRAAEFAGVGAVLAMPTLYAGKLMIWVVQMLAALPGAAMAVRQPPWYLVALLYAGMLLAVVRRRVALSRAQAVNCCVGCAVVAVGWYAFSAPVGAMDVTVLSVGQTSSVLIRAPGGELWAIDAAVPRGSSPTNILGNTMRSSGERRLAGLVLTHLDAPHASSAAEVVERFGPGHVFVSEVDWRHRSETLAGASVDAVASIQHTPVTPLHAGQQLVLGREATLEILWPPKDADPLDHPNLIVRLTCGLRHVLIVDPHGQRALAALTLADPMLRADVVIFTNQERGAADEGLRKTIEPLNARNILWASRGSWAPRASAAGERNAADGAIRLRISASGEITLPPSP
jgi:competence protein ComEC